MRLRWEEAQAKAIDRSIRRGGTVDAFNHLGISMALVTTVLLTTAGAVAIVQQEMSIGGLIAANMLATRIVQPLMQLIQFWRGVEKFRETSERLDGLLSQRIERQAAEVARPRPSGILAAESASFGYAEGTAPVLDSLSITVQPGTLTGIVGDNGCGKSTFLKLLQGLYAPTSGRVMLDNADIAQFGQRDLGQWFGYVPQEPFLFDGTIRDNIAGGRNGVDDEAVLHAATLANAAPFIDALPDGFGSAVGEGGRRLPPGFRQRIALARALAGDPPVLLLDEPSANLDFQTEQALCETMQMLKAERTIVLVSHSTALLQACDTLIVMHGGKIVMTGDADDVLPRQMTPPAGRQHAIPSLASAKERISA